MKVVLIRHAQSENNALYWRLFDRYGRPSPTSDKQKFEEMMREFEDNRDANPKLSSVGYEQAEKLAEGIHHFLDTSPEALDETRIFVSPLRRAIETSIPFLRKVKIGKRRCACHPEIFEVGGCYHANMKEKGGDEAGSGSGAMGINFVGMKGETRKECEDKYGELFSFPESMENGWYHGSSKETHQEAVQRSLRVAEWLWQLVAAEECSVCVLVMHADFMDLVLKALTGEHPRNMCRWVIKNTGIICGSLNLLPPNLAQGQAGPSRRIAVDGVNRVDHLADRPDLIS
uniref:Uncharacterized protein n=1 Tax=Chromera velia CCMP2878 TaxID=1169474 RepID=A0A0G4HCI2_9ALVE|eukprot:Cvel_26174.t1-p1 / transcript=Cvel_26174.t1 / gene=Cvel_26174 / organism=Chromera_velia_CCMP2878 / gene_product=hypothetical protein / transcript_product=hypothetical protein / location=Cvel_scaffold3075:15564-19775(+) / protein_length=286 / sequence_SO=supercontig / SO=protein_coding / is_pseudo=false